MIKAHQADSTWRFVFESEILLTDGLSEATYMNGFAMNFQEQD